MKDSTRISIWPLPNGELIVVDYETMLSDMLELSEMEIIEQISSPHYWVLTLPHMEGSEEDKDLFYADFLEGKQHRENAIKGNKTANHQEAADILNSALLLCDTSDAARDGLVDVDSVIKSAAILGIKIRDVVKHGDSGTLGKMAKLLQEGKIPKGKQGGLGGNYGKMWQAFCRCHLKKMTIPRKSYVRDEAGVPAGFADLKKAANEELDYLGLGGLRE